MRARYWVISAAFVGGVGLTLLLGMLGQDLTLRLVRMSVSNGCIATVIATLIFLITSNLFSPPLYGLARDRRRVIQKMVNSNQPSVVAENELLGEEELVAAHKFAATIVDSSPLMAIFAAVILLNTVLLTFTPTGDDNFDAVTGPIGSVLGVGLVVATMLTLRRAQQAKRFLRDSTRAFDH